MNALSAGRQYLKSEIVSLCWLKAFPERTIKTSKSGERYRLSLMIHSQLSVGTSFNRDFTKSMLNVHAVRLL